MACISSRTHTDQGAPALAAVLYLCIHTYDCNLLIQKCWCKLLLTASLKSSSTAIPALQNRKYTTEKWDLRDKVSRREKYRNAFRTANNTFACFEGIFNFRIIYVLELYWITEIFRLNFKQNPTLPPRASPDMLQDENQDDERNQVNRQEVI